MTSVGLEITFESCGFQSLIRIQVPLTRPWSKVNCSSALTLIGLCACTEKGLVSHKRCFYNQASPPLKGQNVSQLACPFCSKGSFRFFQIALFKN